MIPTFPLKATRLSAIIPMKIFHETKIGSNMLHIHIKHLDTQNVETIDETVYIFV